MADGVFNIAKGRVVEFYNRVENNDPAAAVLRIYLLTVNQVDATLIDHDDMAALLAAANTEALFTNYVNKVLTDTDLAPLPAPDDSADRYEVDIPNIVWTAAGNGVNETMTKFIVAYDALGTDVDSGILPLTHHDFTPTTDGSDLTAVINALGFFRAA